jgi:hypothetical protein
LASVFDNLASKKPGKTSRSRSRPRSRSRTKDKKEPDWKYFVVPLSGILSCIAARLHDMGGNTSQDQQDTERTPLLPDSERPQHKEPGAPAKKAARWVARNAVTVFMSLLILAIILGLCLFFGSKSSADLRVHFQVLKLRLTISPPSRQSVESESLLDSRMRSCLLRNPLQPLTRIQEY